MNRTKLTTALLAVTLVAFLAAPAAEAAKPWEKIKIPELNPIQMPEYERVQLDNGMVIYLAEDHEFPLVELSATIDVGSIYEPADKVGLASMTGEVMRSGGTTTRNGDDIDELVEARGLSVETWIGDNNGGAYLSAMKEDTQLGLDLLADILRNPAFPEDKIKLAKEGQKAGISRRNDDPMTIARREAMKVIFGPDHPSARHPEYDTIAAVTQQDMLDFHADWFGPDRMYLVVIGDFDRKEMLGAIEKVFAGWAPARKALPADPEVPDFPRTVNVVDKDDINQTTVIMGAKGIRADDPNYAGVQVANRILGGGFATRLFNEVRSRQGLAYSVGSSSGASFRQEGLFMAFTMTKSESSQKAASAILTEIGKMTTEPVTDEELERAKDGILNSEVFNYDTKREILDRLVMFERYGYPADFLQTYQEQVKAMTKEQVLAATQAAWHPDRMTLLAVGNYADFDGDFSTFGAVNMVDITIPEPALEIPEATAASLEQGMALMQAARAYCGSQIAGAQGYFQKQVMQASIQGMDLTFTTEMTVSYPDKAHMNLQTPFGTQTIVVNGDSGYAAGMGGKQELTGSDLTDAKDQLMTGLVDVFRSLDGLMCQALDPREVDGVPCLPVYVTGLGEDYQIFFLKAADKSIYMVQEPGTSPMTQAPVTQKMYVDEYAEFGDLKWPKAQRLTYDDELFGSITVEDMALDPKADAALFAN
jgi:zinc protease